MISDDIYFKNIKTVAKFELVSFEQFKSGFENVPEERSKRIYKNLRLPKRATKGSAGYDFYAPFKIVLKPGETLKFPTGIRCKIDDGYVLELYPRSGLGFKYRLQLNNTVGIVDSDYYYSSNEGHIFAKITNDSNEGKTVEIEAGEAFMQGIFKEYFLAEEDPVTTIRDGGFGSTSVSTHSTTEVPSGGYWSLAGSTEK